MASIMRVRPGRIRRRRFVLISLAALLLSISGSMTVHGGAGQWKPALWPRLTISYCVEPGEPGLEATVQSAIRALEQQTSFRFSRTAFDQNARRGCSSCAQGCIRFIRPPLCDSGRCSAPVGWLGPSTPSTVYIAARCELGNILHELGHALGLYHEHNRWDRGRYVNVNWEFVKRSNARQSAQRAECYKGGPVFTAQYLAEKEFKPLELWKADQYGSYDPYSIMHYPVGPGTPLDLTTAGSTFPPDPSGLFIGQRVRLSPTDVAMLRHMYENTPP